jgi:WhiB family redox-sensing transcriptional regulator
VFCELSGTLGGDGLVSGDGSAVPPPDSRRRLVVGEGARAGSEGWMARGACQGADPELFFPVAVMGRAVEQISSAKAVCGRCEVDKNCLSYALETMPHGIWGGTTREERIAMRVPPAVQVQVQVHGPGEAPGRGVWPLSL